MWITKFNPKTLDIRKSMHYSKTSNVAVYVRRSWSSITNNGKCIRLRREWILISDEFYTEKRYFVISISLSTVQETACNMSASRMGPFTIELNTHSLFHLIKTWYTIFCYILSFALRSTVHKFTDF